MDQRYLLNNERAESLYQTVKYLPIIDFHNHLSVKDIKENRRFEDLYRLWLECDPYKHRLMRISGIDEHFITGDAEPFEKVEKFIGILPYLAGNPVFDWSRMELLKIFGINELPTKSNATYIYDKCNEMLASEEFYAGSILARFNLEYQAPVATPLEDLSVFDGKVVAPSLRADELLSPSEGFKGRLEQRTGVRITDTKSYLSAIGKMLDQFKKKGCKFCDHALDAGFFDENCGGEAANILKLLGIEYSKRKMTLLLHVDANRSTSERLREIAGSQGGFAAVGGRFNYTALTKLLSDMERGGGLPDTVIFPLNMSDQPQLAVLQGSFSENGVSSKVGLGPAWWWCDHKTGIRNTLDAISSFGVLSEFIGMTTDSRSILSMVRHDYFRRILCSYLIEKAEGDLWDLPFDILSDIARKICYENAKKKIERT